MLRTKIMRNNKGILLLTVILLTVILSMVAISVMSVNVSQVKSSQSIVDSIKADQMAMGVFYLCHQQLTEDPTASCPEPSMDLDGKTFSSDIVISSGVGPNARAQGPSTRG